jgi:CheY-like chemotaxis protein
METRKKRVLVVDDSASARLTLQRMLEAHGLIVDLAHSAEDALD